MHYEAVRSVQLLEDSRTPEVTPETRRIWKQWKEESVEDRLLRLERERKERLEELRNRAKQREAAFPFSPTVNVYSRARPSDVSLHLYEKGLEDRKKRESIGELKSQFSGLLKGRNEAGNACKSPVRRALNMFSKSQLPLRDFLARNYWGQLHKFKKTVSPDCSLDSECVFRPQINASYTERQSREDVYERLLAKKRLSQSRTYEKSLEMRQTESSKCTFQPHLHSRAFTPPPQSLSSHKVPLKSLSPAPSAPRRPAESTHKGEASYVDSKTERHSLAVRHCSGRWKELAELEEVEARMQALGVVYR